MTKCCRPAQPDILLLPPLLLLLQATGLALPGSDLDVVLLGTPCPKTKSAADGFRVKDRNRVKNMLKSLRQALCKAGHASQASLVIIDARVPLCKGTMKFSVNEAELLAALVEDERAAAGTTGDSGGDQSGTSIAAAAAAADGSSGGGGRGSALSAVVAMVKDAVRRNGIGSSADQQQRPGSRAWQVSLPVDLSLGVANGAAAVSFIMRQVSKHG